MAKELTSTVKGVQPQCGENLLRKDKEKIFCQGVVFALKRKSHYGTW
ncbi:hypothetical protein [Desulfofundulus salinus]|nr:hypothetical protein [Desulfofundulus salinum]